MLTVNGTTIIPSEELITAARLLIRQHAETKKIRGLRFTGWALEVRNKSVTLVAQGQVGEQSILVRERL